MFNKKYFLIVMALVYSISLGSLVYIWYDYKQLFIFLQIITLPAIYYVGYEILMEKQKNIFDKSFNEISQIVEQERNKNKENEEKIKKVSQFLENFNSIREETENKLKKFRKKYKLSK